MNISLYEGVYLFTNLFDTYVIYLFMNIIFKTAQKNNRYLFLAYAFRYVVTTLFYLYLPYPYVTVTVSFLTLFVIAMCFKSKMSNRIIAVFLSYLTFFACETIIAALIGLSNFSMFAKSRNGGAFDLVVVSVLSFVVVKCMGRFRNIDISAGTPWSFFVTAIAVAVISICFGFSIVMQKDLNDIVFFLSLISILLLNFIIFYLYDSITKAMNQKMQNESINHKIEYYEKQAELIQKNSDEVKQLRHDMKNHLIVIEELLKENNTQGVLDYLSNIGKKLTEAKKFCSTGIVAVDSIVNYKLSLAQEQGVRVISQITIPDSLDFEPNDIVAIFGNLLDNALEAVGKVDGDKFIDLYCEYDRGIIFIVIKNSYDGNLSVSDNKYQTTKSYEKSMHGIGLQSIKATVEKYNGEINVEHNDSEFKVHTILLV